MHVLAKNVLRQCQKMCVSSHIAKNPSIVSLLDKTKRNSPVFSLSAIHLFTFHWTPKFCDSGNAVLQLNITWILKRTFYQTFYFLWMGRYRAKLKIHVRSWRTEDLLAKSSINRCALQRLRSSPLASPYLAFCACSGRRLWQWFAKTANNAHGDRSRCSARCVGQQYPSPERGKEGQRVSGFVCVHVCMVYVDTHVCLCASLCMCASVCMCQ